MYFLNIVLVGNLNRNIGFYYISQWILIIMLRAGIAQSVKRLARDLDEQGVGARVPVRAKIFTSPRRQTGCGAHPACSPMGTRVSFSWGKEAGT
jgi:hypothetical protein